MGKILATYLNQVEALTEECNEDLERCIESFVFPKRKVILKAGEVCRYLYFVNQGLVRLFYDKDGNEITDYFAFEGNFIGGIASFFSQKPSDKAIETIEETVIEAISFTNLQSLYDKHHCFERVGRVLTTQAFLSMQERLYSLQFHTAKERYSALLSKNPDVLKRAPLGQIASYLGVTQTTLSRIRAEL